MRYAQQISISSTFDRKYFRHALDIEAAIAKGLTTKDNPNANPKRPLAI